MPIKTVMKHTFARFQLYGDAVTDVQIPSFCPRIRRRFPAFFVRFCRFRIERCSRANREPLIFVTLRHNVHATAIDRRIIQSQPTTHNIRRTERPKKEVVMEPEMSVIVWRLGDNLIVPETNFGRIQVSARAVPAMSGLWIAAS